MGVPSTPRALIALRKPWWRRWLLRLPTLEPIKNQLATCSENGVVRTAEALQSPVPISGVHSRYASTYAEHPPATPGHPGIRLSTCRRGRATPWHSCRSQPLRRFTQSAFVWSPYWVIRSAASRWAGYVSARWRGFTRGGTSESANTLGSPVSVPVDAGASPARRRPAPSWGGLRTDADRFA